MAESNFNTLPPKAIVVDGLTKQFGNITAVDNLSFEVPRGELFGIIGPDGAGKTTLFRLLTSLMHPTDGNAYVDGLHTQRDYKLIRQRVGYMPGKFSLYQDMSVRENLDFFASVFGTTIEQNYELIKDIYCRLEPFADRKASKLSGGMKQKLALCCALIHAPSVLFLDEPTTGVDPSSRREFWDMLTRLREHNITIIVSTAYMDEASRCDRVAMMNNGRFMAINTPKDLIRTFDRKLLAIRADNMFQLLNDLRNINAIDNCYTFGEYHHATIKPAINENINEHLIETLTSQYKHTNLCIEDCTPTLEDCFILYSR